MHRCARSWSGTDDAQYEGVPTGRAMRQSPRLGCGGTRACFLVISILAISAPSRADTIQLYAAGSLRAPLTEIAKSFEAETANNVQAKYGATA
jgi:hypothetical protein